MIILAFLVVCIIAYLVLVLGDTARATQSKTYKDEEREMNVSEKSLYTLGHIGYIRHTGSRPLTNAKCDDSDCWCYRISYKPKGKK